MSAELDDLLADASVEPDAPDAAGIWAAGRRRRRWMQAGGVATAAASIAMVGLVVVGVNPTPAPTVDPLAEGGEESSEPAPIGDTGEAVPPGDELPRFEPPPIERSAPEEEEREVEEEAPSEPQAEAEAEAEAEATPSPQPDAAAVADPCAPHQGREMDAFIDLVAPVSGQEVGGTVELVGCSNVPEANVRYRVLDGAGAVLVDHFTTATCGTGCVGEFRESVTVTAGGDVTVQVFWDSPKDGSEEDLTEVVVSAG
jgi:hypothetical protein